MVTGLLAELTFAFSTHDNDDAHGAQNPSADEPANLEAVPVIVERTVFIFWVIGVQDRQAYQEHKQAQGHLLHVRARACVVHQAEQRFREKSGLQGGVLPLSEAATP